MPDRYDDGGFSGATLERPALRRLLADIEAGRVDVVVVYKIDRLSRALMDFAKLVEVFDRHGVTFVSVTQSFNTTTSMGRLTLNILLSFAQFEREVIGERIRDKFAASRARGMWMGGKVPLGYDVRDRKLVVNEAEAARVRRVFALFAETGSGVETVRRLRAEGITGKTGRLLEKGDLYKLLQQSHLPRRGGAQGQLVSGRACGDRSARALGPRARPAAGEPARPGQPQPEPDAGAAAGPDLRRGRAGHVAHAHAAPRPALPLLRGQSVLKAREADPAIVRRVSAAEIEGAVIDQLRALLRQPEIIVGTWRAAREEAPDLTEAEVRESLAQLDPLWEELFPAEQARIVRLLVERVEVGPDGADIRLRVAGLTSLMRELSGPASEAQRAAA